MIRAIIIDDEQHCIDSILELCKDHNDILIEGAYKTVDDGVKATNEINPDLVFLDVEIHDKTGFNYLEHFHTHPFHVVFTTAYDKYAVKAFEFSALHYLLKPITSDHFKEVLKRITNTNSLETLNQRIDTLLYNQNVREDERRITINNSESTSVLHLKEILYCKADVNCTYFFLKDNKKVFSSKTLKTFVELFESSDFYRVDQSFLVNLKHVKKFTKGKPSFVIMSNGKSIKVAISRKPGLMKRLNNLR